MNSVLVAVVDKMHTIVVDIIAILITFALIKIITGR